MTYDLQPTLYLTKGVTVRSPLDSRRRGCSMTNVKHLCVCVCVGEGGILGSVCLYHEAVECKVPYHTIHSEQETQPN